MSDALNAQMDTTASKSISDWRVFAVAGILALAALGAYWNSFNVPFLLDDVSAIGENPSIRHLEQIGNVLSPSPTGPTAARPLLNLSFALNYAWGGMSVRSYHVVNLLIHICAGLALLGIVRRTLLLPNLRERYGKAALPLAGFAALLWTLHPLQTESITYISQRAESLMGLFYLLTLYGFIREVSPNLTEDNKGNGVRREAAGSSSPSERTPASCCIGWLIASAAACFCGMATKQVMATAPVLVLLYDRAFVSGSFRSALANRRWYYASLAATWLLLGFLMHQSSLTEVGAGFQAGVSWQTYALTELRVVADYLKLAFWPHPLIFDYGSEILVTNPLTALPYALIVVAILVGVMIMAWRRSPMAGFLGCCFFLILAPTSTVIPIVQQPMAESRMYLPLAAVVVLVTLLSYIICHRRTFAALGFLVVGLGTLTVYRNHDYRSELSIWEDTIDKFPHTSRAHSLLGVSFAKIPGRMSDAITHYEEALRINPANAEAHNNLANALAGMPNRLTEAIAHYETAIRIKPDFAEAHNNLANALARIPNRLTEAIAHYETAIRIKPDFSEAHSNFATILTKIPGRMADAIAHCDEALRIQSDYAEAHNSLGNILMKMPGQVPEAIIHYEEALRIQPDYAEAHNNLGAALTTIPNRLDEAIIHCREALRLRPTYAEAHYNLANALVKAPGRSDDAIAHYEEALRLQPDYPEAHYNLANALAKIPTRRVDAIIHYEAAVRLKPDFIEAHNNLAYMYLTNNDLESAIEQMEIAASLAPDSAAIRDGLRKLRARQKQ